MGTYQDLMILWLRLGSDVAKIVKIPFMWAMWQQKYDICANEIVVQRVSIAVDSYIKVADARKTFMTNVSYLVLYEKTTISKPIIQCNSHPLANPFQMRLNGPLMTFSLSH